MKLAFIANSQMSVQLFRGAVIQHFIAQKYEIVVIVPKSEGYGIPGVREIFLSMERKGTNPLKDLIYYFKLKSIYKKEKFDLAFHYTIKPNIYGGLAAHAAKTKCIAVTTGLGYVFLNNDIKSKVARLLYKLGLRHAEQVWFLNADDRDDFLKRRLVNFNKTMVLPGEGIDAEYFRPDERKNKDGKVKFLLIARLLKEKGIYEYFKVARRITARFPDVEFHLLGDIDKGSPSFIDKRILKEHIENKSIRYFGFSKDVRPYIKEVDAVVLPSYREGIPRTLMEAMSMEKPIITTNSVGCKELIVDGYNGFMCEPRNCNSLYQAMLRFLKLSEQERISQGKNGRSLVKQKFHKNIIIDIYDNAIIECVK